MKLSTFHLTAAFAFSILVISIPAISPISAFPPGMNKVQAYSFGPISSIQNDPSGNPAWIVSGTWKSNLPINATDQNASAAAPNATFSSNVNMIMLNGSAGHTHSITNFVLTDTAQENGTVVFNGTSTASMREGPVTDIPTTIRVMGDRVISIWLDPTKINEHYGDTPIYGLLVKDKEKPNYAVNNTRT